MMPGCKQQAMGNGNDTVSFHLLRGGFPPAAQWFPAIEPQAAKPEPQIPHTPRAASKSRAKSQPQAHIPCKNPRRKRTSPAKIQAASAHPLQKPQPQAHIPCKNPKP